MSSKSRGGLSKREYKKKYGKSSSSSKNSKKIDYSKRSSGTSKREYQASQLGGTLDKKNNTISVRRKSPTSSGVKAGPSRAGEVNPGFYNPYTQQVQTHKVSDYDTDKKTQSNRSNASKEYNTKTSNVSGGGFGSNTTNSGGNKSRANIKTSNPTGFGKGLQWLNETLGYGYGQLAGSEDKMLGLTQQLMGGDRGITESPWVKRATDLFGVPTANAMLRDDPTSGGDFRNPQTVSAINPWDVGGAGEDRAISQQQEVGNNPITNYPTSRPDATYEQDVIDTSNLGGNDRPTPTPTDTGGSISTPQTIQDVIASLTQNQSQLPTPPDGGAIQYDNPTVSRIAGKGNYARGLGYNSEQGLVGGGGLGLGGEDDEMNILQKILASIGMINSAQASQVPRDNGGFSGQKDYSYNSATIPTNYGYQAENPEGPAPIIQPQEEEPIEYNQTNNQNYEQDYTGGGGNMNAPADRGGLSKREYAAKYGQEWDPSGGLGDFGYAGDDSYDDQYSEQKRQLADMIKGIESQYATAQTKQTGDLERQGRQNLNQLNSQFSFGNSDPNDEQRIQYQQRLQNDQGRNLAELLSSLQAAKGQDILSARNQGSTNMQNLMNQQRQAKSNAQQGRQSYQQQLEQMRQSSSGGSTPKSYGTALDGIMKQYGVDATTARKIYNQKNGLVSQDPLSALLGLGAEGGFTGQPVGQGNSQIEFEGKLYNVDSIGNMSPA